MSYLLNALPGSIIPAEGIVLSIDPVSRETLAAALMKGRVDGDTAGPVQSAIGHADTAALIAADIGVRVVMARVSIPVLEPGDVHWLALYQGPRLPEGATTLPAGVTLSYFRLTARVAGSAG